MPLYVSKYERATSRLSLAEDGAYMRLIRDYWVNGAPPDNDSTIARILRVERREWLRIRPTLERFFDIRDGHWFHDTVDRELERARAIIEKRRDAGRQGGRPPKQSESKPKPNGFPDEKQSGSQTETPARVALPLPPPNGGLSDANASSVETSSTEPWAKDVNFGKAWDACTAEMRKRSSKAKSWAEWKKARGLTSGADLAAAVPRYVAADPDIQRTGGPGFHIWLKDRKWEHWLASSETSRPSPAFPGPASLRADVVKAQDEAFAANYLDPCGWQEVPRKALIPRTSYALEQLRKGIGHILDREGIDLTLTPSGRAVA